MTERNMFRSSVVCPPADLMIASFDDEAQSEAFRLAGELRTQGLRVFLNPEPGNPGKHKVYARDRDIPFMIVVGSTERETGIFRLENPKIKDPVDVSRQRIADVVRQKLKSEAEAHKPLAEAIEPFISKPR
jgi:histidyl-tRNA synthetase